LSPGREAGLANHRRRSWAPRKYASPEMQDTLLESLQARVADQYERAGD
jgi:hypothetical protein